MDIKHLLAEEDRLLKEAQAIVMQDRFLTDEDTQNLVRIRDQVMDLKRQLASNPHFHPETLNNGYLN